MASKLIAMASNLRASLLLVARCLSGRVEDSLVGGFGIPKLCVPKSNGDLSCSFPPVERLG